MKQPERVKKARAAIVETKELLLYFLGKESSTLKDLHRKFNDLDNLLSELSMDQKTYGNWLAKKIKRDMNRSERKKGKK